MRAQSWHGSYAGFARRWCGGALPTRRFGGSWGPRERDFELDSQSAPLADVKVNSRSSPRRLLGCVGDVNLMQNFSGVWLRMVEMLSFEKSVRQPCQPGAGTVRSQPSLTEYTTYCGWPVLVGIWAVIVGHGRFEAPPCSAWRLLIRHLLTSPCKSFSGCTKPPNHLATSKHCQRPSLHRPPGRNWFAGH